MKELSHASLNVTLSNSYAQLFDVLEREFVQSKSRTCFRRLIVVQDSASKSIVGLELSRRLGILFGVDVITLREVLEKFSDASSLRKSSLFQQTDSVYLYEKALIYQWYGLEVEDRLAAKITELCDNRAGLKLKTHYDEIFIFGITSLCPRLHNMFVALSQKAHVSFYILSFCMMFWTDIYSDNQIKKLNIIDDTLYDRSSILANCGMLQKAYAKLLDYTVQEIHEAYVPAIWAQEVRPDAVVRKDNSKKTLLKSVQHDILLLESPKATPTDTTIQVHAAPTIEREVSLCFEKLAAFVKETKSSLKACDIVIFTPCIETYRPYIERMASRCHLPIQIVSSNQLKETGLIRTLLHLLSLSQRRCRAEDIDALLSSAPFLKKLHLSPEDISSIKMALQKMEFGWQETAIKETALLDDFQMRFITMWSQDSAECISVREAESIASFIHTLKMLFQDVSMHSFLPLIEWVFFIDELTEKYFFIDNEHAFEQELLFQVQNRLIHDAEADNSEIDMQTFVRLFHYTLDDVQRNFICHIKAPIVCASLGFLRGYPAKYISLLGMQEGAFPRNKSSFLVSMGACLQPGMTSHQVLDKSLFLEALASAQEAIFISYQNYSFEDHSTLYPSGCVQDLISSYTLEVTQHSIDSCLEVAAEKISPNTITAKNDCIHTVKRQVDLSLLMEVARSPLKPYYQRHANLSFFDKGNVRYEDVFSLITHKAFRKTVTEAFFQEPAMQKLCVEKKFAPLPPLLQQACSRNILKELACMDKHASDLGILDKTPLIIELNGAIDAPYEKNKGHFIFPSIKLAAGEVVGSLQGICREGIVLFTKKSAEDLIRLWPKILILLVLKEQHGLDCRSDILFLHEPYRMHCVIDAPQDKLERFVQYANQCEDRPYCLYPELLRTLLSSDVPPNPLVNTDGRFYVDPYLAFFMQQNSPEDVAAYWGEWQKTAKQLAIDECFT